MNIFNVAQSDRITLSGYHSISQGASNVSTLKAIELFLTAGIFLAIMLTLSVALETFSSIDISMTAIAVVSSIVGVLISASCVYIKTTWHQKLIMAAIKNGDHYTLWAASS